MECEHKNQATVVVPPYKTYCLDCKKVIEGNRNSQRMREILQEMETYPEP